jgi:hypothetical protein
MEALVQRFFGRSPKDKSADILPAAPKDPESLFKLIHISLERYGEIIEAAHKKIEAKGQLARRYARSGLELEAQKQFAQRQKLAKNLSFLTDRQLILENIVEALSMLEAEKLLIGGASNMIDLVNSVYASVNEENALNIREEFEEKQRELARIHRIMSKPMQGAPVLNEADFDEAWEAFLEQDEITQADETDDEVPAVKSETTVVTAVGSRKAQLLSQ